MARGGTSTGAHAPGFESLGGDSFPPGILNLCTRILGLVALSAAARGDHVNHGFLVCLRGQRSVAVWRGPCCKHGTGSLEPNSDAWPPHSCGRVCRTFSVLRLALAQAVGWHLPWLPRKTRKTTSAAASHVPCLAFATSEFLPNSRLLC